MSTTVEPRPAPASSPRYFVVITVFALLISVLVGAAHRDTAMAAQAPQAAAPEGGTPAARGEYLTTRVAMCVQCHSGRDRHGNILESEKFKGAPIPFQSPFPEKEWAVRAPALAGLPGFTDAQVIALLTEGRATDRSAPRSPMPPFRMSRQDAEAIVAYLRTR